MTAQPHAPATPAPPLRGIRGEQARLWIAIGVVLVDSIGYGVLVPLLPFVVLHMGGRPALVTQLVAVYSFASFIGAPVVGAWSDRFGRVRAIRLTLLLGAAVYAGIALAWSLAALFLLRGIAGVLAGRNAVIRALVTDGIPAERHAAHLGWLTAAAPLGSAIGPLLGVGVGYLVHDPLWHFRSAFLLVALLTLVTLGLVFLAWPEAAAVRLAARPTRAKGGLRNVAGPLALNAGTSYGYGVILSVTALFVHARFNWSEMQTGWLMALAAGGVTLARAVLSPWISRRLGNARGVAVCAAASAPILVLLGLSSSPWMFVLCFASFIVLGSVAMLLPTVMISVASAPEHRGYLLGWAQGAAALATTASASLNGLLFDFVAPSAPHVLGAIVLLGSALLAALLGARPSVRRAG